ncbi:hypothetical protein EON78_04695 [bacterium]|nr:MAG: hypothetical protein EON78_04695 [bacterium]
MKKLISKRGLIVSSLVVFFTIVLFISCNKSELLPKTELAPKAEAVKISQTLIDSLKSLPQITYNFTEQPVKLFPLDTQGNILNSKEVKQLRSGARTMELCDGDLIDEGAYTAIFKGVYYSHEVFNNAAVVTLEYELTIPANIETTGNTGTFFLKAQNGLGSLKYTSNTISAELLGTLMTVYGKRI